VGLPSAAIRDYEIATILHIDPLTADEVPALRLDWMLAIARARREFEAEQAKKQEAMR
jgi:hypothetical protein